MANSSPSPSSSLVKDFPVLSITSEHTLKLCKGLKVDENDLFICSYPKSGTTWMQHIVLSLLLSSQQKHTSLDYQHVSDYAPFYEIDPHWDHHYEGAEGRLIEKIQQKQALFKKRIFNTHLHYNMLPRGAKYIYLIRSPLDACVSFYNHLSHQVEDHYDGSIEDFMMDWMHNKVAFGTWWDSVLSFINHSSLEDQHEDKILYVFYEDLTDDLSNQVKRVANFLNVQLEEEEEEELLKTFSFQAMRADIQKFQPKSVQWKDNFCFLRKGKVGDSTRALSQKLQLEFRKLLETLSFKHRVQNSMLQNDYVKEKILKLALHE